MVGQRGATQIGIAGQGDWLTSGLGVALLTTMVGLVGNILLGLQLTRMDRFADQLLAQAQRHGLIIGR